MCQYVLTNQPTLTHSLAPYSRVLLEKLIVTKLVKKIPTFYGSKRFIIMFTRAYHWLLSLARCIKSTRLHAISLRSILILSSQLCLCLPGGLFTSGILTNILDAFLVSPTCGICPTPLILPDFIILIILGEVYKL